MKIFCILFTCFMSAPLLAQQQLYDWGTTPSSSQVTLPTWPNTPSASVRVNIGNISAFNSSIVRGNRYLTLTANISSSLSISSNDNIIDLNGFEVGGVFVNAGSKRNKVFNGHVSGSLEAHGTDVVFDQLSVISSSGNLFLSNSRQVLTNSTFRFSNRSSAYITEGATDIVIGNSDFENSTSGFWGLRVMGPERFAILDSRFRPQNNQPIRLHAGDISNEDGLHNGWIARNQVEGNGAPAAFWFNLGSGVPINPGSSMSRIVVEDNRLYNSEFVVASEPASPSRYNNMFFYRNRTFNDRNVTYPPDFANPTQITFPLSGANANTVSSSRTVPRFIGGFDSPVILAPIQTLLLRNSAPRQGPVEIFSHRF